MLAAALASLTLTGCEVGAYPLDIFPEMHYQESYRVQEPPYVPIPEGSVPTSGAEYVIAQAEMTDLPNPIRLDDASIAGGQVGLRGQLRECATALPPTAFPSSPGSSRSPACGLRHRS